MAILLILLMAVLTVFLHAHERARRRKWMKQAQAFNPPNAHGGARFANNDDLRNGGLL